MNGNDGQPTGDARVDAALARFDELAEAPLTAHPEIFEDVHRRLQDALTGIDERALPEQASADGTEPPERDETDSTGEPHRRPTGPGGPLYGAEYAGRPSPRLGRDPVGAEGDVGG